VPNAGYSFKRVENIAAVIIAHSGNPRFASGIFELLRDQRMMKLPFSAESLERRQIGNTNATSLGKSFAIRRHARLANALVQLEGRLSARILSRRQR
jgi:hypothetical protein